MSLFYNFLIFRKEEMIMKSKRTPYVGAELDIVRIDSLDVITTSGETGDSFDYVDKDPTSWDS